MPTFSSYNALGTTIETGELSDGSVTAVKLADGVASMSLVSTQTVSGSAVQQVDFSSLDSDTDGKYILYGSINATSGASGRVYIFLNADETITNYYYQGLTANSTTVAGDRQNFPAIGNVAPNDVHYFELTFEQIASEHGMWRGTYKDKGPSDLGVGVVIGQTSGTLTNITKISIQTASGTYIDVGSTFSLYKVAE